MSNNQPEKRTRGRPPKAELFAIPPEIAQMLGDVGFFDGAQQRWSLWPNLPKLDKIGLIYRLRAATQRALLRVDKEALETVVGRSWKQIGRYLQGDAAPNSVYEAIAVAADLPTSWLLTGDNRLALDYIQSAVQDDEQTREKRASFFGQKHSELEKSKNTTQTRQDIDNASISKLRTETASSEADFGVPKDGGATRKAFAERLRLLIGQESQRDFGQRIGVGQATLSQYLLAKTEPTWSTLVQIATTTGCSFDWLMAGHGSGGAKLKQTPDECLEIPLYDMRASTRRGSMVFKERAADHLVVPAKILGLSANEGTKLAAFDIVGNAMEPTLFDGDTIIIDRRYELIDRDGIYMLSIGGDLDVKRVTRVYRTGGVRFSISSDNPAYPPFDIKREDLQGVGRVIWVSSRRRQ